jgi:microcompartment protein CcmK/EutM
MRGSGSLVVVADEVVLDDGGGEVERLLLAVDSVGLGGGLVVLSSVGPAEEAAVQSMSWRNLE